VSTSSDGLQASAVDSARTSQGVSVSGGRDANIQRTGNFQATSTNFFNYKPVSVHNAKNIQYNHAAQTITFDTGDLTVQLPNSNDIWTIPDATKEQQD